VKYDTARLAVLLSIALAGCAAMGLTTPKTTDQKLAYAEGAVIAAQQSISQATKAGLLSSAQATNANNMTLSAQAVINTARALETSNPTGAANDLTLATSAVTAISTYLTAAGVK